MSSKMSSTALKSRKRDDAALPAKSRSVTLITKPVTKLTAGITK